jgi:hypothetical protein
VTSADRGHPTECAVCATGRVPPAGRAVPAALAAIARKIAGRSPAPGADRGNRGPATLGSPRAPRVPGGTTRPDQVIWMATRRSKVSGYLRSMDGAEVFCAIPSCPATATATASAGPAALSIGAILPSPSFR